MLIAHLLFVMLVDTGASQRGFARCVQSAIEHAGPVTKTLGCFVKAECVLRCTFAGRHWWKALVEVNTASW